MRLTYPLTQSQHDVFSECIQDQTLSEYNLSWEIDFPKDTGISRLRNAVEAIIEARPIFRNRLLIDDSGNPRQYSDPELQIPIPQLRMSGEELQEYIKHELSRPYNLLGGEPLCRFAIVETEKCLHLLHSMQHTTSDGVTICSLYLRRDLPAALAGKPIRKEAQTIYEYALEEEKLIGTEAYEEASRLYAERFAGVKPTELRPYTGATGNLISCDIKMKGNSMRDWCRQHHLQSVSLMQAAFTLVLSRWSREQKVSYISIRHGRNHRQQLTSYGLYANMMPVVSDADPEMSVLDFIKQVADDWHATLLMNNHSMYKFCQATGCTPSIFFAYQGNMCLRSTIINGKKLPSRQLVHGLTDDDLQCMIYDVDDDYEIHMEASDALYDEAYIIRFGEAINDNIKEMMAKPECKLKYIA